MPYKNIVFIKLEKRLLNDHRWFGMSDKAQLLYVKLMLGCAETYNKLPTDSLTLRKQLRIEWRKDVFDSAIKEIQDRFPKFKKDGKFYSFEEFETKTNYIRECPSNAEGTPKEVIDIDIDKDIYKEKSTGRFTPPSLDELSDYILQNNFTTDPHQFIDFYQSKGWMVGKNKMKDWKAAVRNWEKRNGTNKKDSPRGSIDVDKYKGELATIK